MTEYVVKVRISYKLGEGPPISPLGLLNSAPPTSQTKSSCRPERAKKSLVMSLIEINHEAQSRAEGSRHESSAARGITSTMAGTAWNTEGRRLGSMQDAFAAFNPTEPNEEIGFE